MKRWIIALAGGLAGFANGLFGGGGGMVLLPLLSRFGKLPERQLYATCVGVIFPVCLVSALFQLHQLSLSAALPYLLGGAAGGALGAKLYRKVPTAALRLLFGCFLLYAGVKYLL